MHEVVHDLIGELPAHGYRAFQVLPLYKSRATA
jgi:hypothetical protein